MKVNGRNAAPVPAGASESAIGGKSTAMRLKDSRLILLALIIALALGIRLWGIAWGLPNAQHYFSYHPDETVMLLHSSNVINPDGLNVFGGQLLPHFYNYGSLQLYLIDIVTSVVAAYTPHSSGVDIGQKILPYYLAGRTLSAVMGAATVWALWAFGRRIYGEIAGLFGALLLAIAPLHAQQSHFMTVDVPATLWVVLSLLWCARSLTDTSKLKSLAIAGAFAGMAAATKYNCALAILPVLVASFVNSADGVDVGVSKRATNALLAVCAMVIAYLACCPGTILESMQFVRDFQMEAVHVSSQQELWFQDTGIGWWYVVQRNLVDGLGLPLLTASIAGLLYALSRRTAGDLLSLSFALPYYLVVGAAVSRYARYEVPLLPLLCLLAARPLTDPTLFPTKKAVNAVLLLCGLVVASTAVSAITLLTPFNEVDPRDRAELWLATHSAVDDSITMPVEPWFWSPPLSPYFALPGVGNWLSAPGGEAVAHRLSIDQANISAAFDGAQLEAQKPKLVVMSEYEYFDRLRTRDVATDDYMAILKQRYEPPIVFADRHWLGGKRFIEGLPCQDLPHDMLYPSATILIFRRR